MAIYKNDIVDVELNGGGILRERMNRRIGKSDDDANRFGVRVKRNGEAESMAGISCAGYFTNSQGGRITLTGTVSGNEAYVTLTDACYTYAGPFRLAIKLSGGGVTSTVRIVDGMVENIV
jgi:uncharacterized Ntn-hydrolase superfamily protein